MSEGAADAVLADEIPEARSFVGRLRRDYDAVVAGRSGEHSSDAVEGSVNRVQLFKWQMSCAGFDLLRTRILLPKPSTRTPPAARWHRPTRARGGAVSATGQPPGHPALSSRATRSPFDGVLAPGVVVFRGLAGVGLTRLPGDGQPDVAVAELAAELDTLRMVICRAPAGGGWR